MARKGVTVIVEGPGEERLGRGRALQEWCWKELNPLSKNLMDNKEK